MRVKLIKTPTFGLYRNFGLYRISVSSGFGLDRFYCINLYVLILTGALESDYPVDEEILKAESYPQYNVPIDDKDNQTTDSGIGGISFVQCATGKPDSRSATPTSSPFGSPKSTGR